MALVILGVCGGFLSFGFLGLFVGSALMAVATTRPERGLSPQHFALSAVPPAR